MGNETVVPTLGLNFNTIQGSLSATLLALLLFLFGSYISSPLRKYPGPFLARFTNLWRLFHVTRGSFHLVIDELHKKYGPIVRIGPNVIDVDYPELIKTVFNIKGDWKKTESVRASSALVEGHIVYNLFSEIDVEKHAREKKPIAKFYSPTGVAPLEPHMDKSITQLCDELEKRFIPGKPFDLCDWITYYTWDVVGNVTFSEPLGYLAAGRDFDGTLSNAEKALDYFSMVTCIPRLDYWLDKNPVYRIGPPGFGGITGVSINRLIARYQGADSAHHSAAVPDYLDKFIEAKNANPDTVNDNQIVSWLMINMIAGADTTAVILRTAFYHALRNPGIWSRLRAELSAAGLDRPSSPVSFKVARSLPYLDALIRESLRILPGVSLGLERYVPPGGVVLPTGDSLPQDTILSMNPYILCRNKEVFGKDADEFRPERWLRAEGEAEEVFANRLRAMNDADLSFGGGSRICLGKHMALMQIYKVVATVVGRYEVVLDDRKKDWKVVNSFFPRQTGIIVRMEKR
ncbi:cytochrome P450 [Podospora aff. communis PSN243]|uniref:Cytochrome P450 n=1 Tax=Podospora aff. communis PSN243 TaxID=3040156 RepID=A0AAV9G6H4_9PEZI|nr:cytochrome P450 [Podospora aff. communis PSN243]